MYPKCNFCSSEYSDELFHDVYPNAKTSILYKTKNFYISIDGYPVCENHLLIVPFDHELSFSNLNKEYSEELEELLNYMKKIYNNCNSYVLFEHGNNRKKGDKRSFGNSVNHAHMHFIPYKIIDKNEIINYCFKNENTKLKLKEGVHYNNCFFENKSRKNILDYIKEDLPTNEPYLFLHFVKEKAETLCITENSIDGEIPSQYFRKLLAIFMNPNEKNPFYDWKISTEVKLSQNQRINIINRIFTKFSIN